MSRKFLFLSVIGLVLIGMLWSAWEGEKTIRNNDSAGTDIIAFGDSLIAGVGAEEGMTLPEQLGRKLGVSITNEGISGATTRDGVRTIDSVLTNYHPKLVIISLGGNDFLQKIPREETIRNLSRIIETIQKKKSMVLILGVRSGLISGGFDEEFEKLASQYKTLYVEDILSGIFGDTRYMSDAVHPNGLGYGLIADRIVKTLHKEQIILR